jgi:hypothetical protein
LIDTSSVSFGSAPAPSNKWSTGSELQNIPYSKLPDQQQNLGQTSTALSVGGQPVATVQQSPIRSIVNALITVIFVVIFGFGIGLASYGALIAVAILAAIIAIPVVLGFLFRPKFEFYDSYFSRVSRRNSQQIDYSEIKSVEKYRSSLRIVLKTQEGERFGPRAILVPGDPKLSDGTDLSAWLKSKVPASPQAPEIPQNDSQESSEPSSL